MAYGARGCSYGWLCCWWQLHNIVKQRVCKTQLQLQLHAWLRDLLSNFTQPAKNVLVKIPICAPQSFSPLCRDCQDLRASNVSTAPYHQLLQSCHFHAFALSLFRAFASSRIARSVSPLRPRSLPFTTSLNSTPSIISFHTLHHLSTICSHQARDKILSYPSLSITRECMHMKRLLEIC